MIIILTTVGVSLFVLGGWAGWTLGRRQAREEYADVLERIEPPSRTPGQPTNVDAAPARVTEAKRRPGHFMS